MKNWEEILNKLDHKDTGNRNTTSKKFKQDLINFFSPMHCDEWHAIEVGSARGHTTKILSCIFGKVDAYECNAARIAIAKETTFGSDNITFHEVNVYKDKWPVENYDVAFIDCDHKYDGINQDINNAFKFSNKLKFLIFDDYGAHAEVKRAIDDNNWRWDKITNIGCMDYLPNIGDINGPEGLICGVKK